MIGAWDEILRHGRPVRELRDVAPRGRGVPGERRRVAHGRVQGREGASRERRDLPVGGEQVRPQPDQHVRAGRTGSEMRFAGALRPAVDRREAARWQGI
mgnify:CR=1 FL=1